MPKRWHIYWFAQVFVRFLFKLFLLINHISKGKYFFSVEIESEEILRKVRPPILIIANHRTYIDHFFVLVKLPIWSPLLPARAMAAEWLFLIPWYKFGFLVRLLLRILGDYRSNRGEGIDVAVLHPLRIIRAGGSVMIYPEGRLNKEPELAKFRAGAPYCAYKTGVLVLPLGISGLENFSLRTFFLGGRKIVVRVGEPFRVRPFDIHSPQEVERAAEDMRGKVKILCEK